MASHWFSYINRIKHRLVLDRSFFRDACVVAKILAYYKFGKGRRTLSSDAMTLAFFPHPVGPWYNIWTALQNTGVRIISALDEADFIFIFDDVTETDAADNLPKGVNAKLINHRVTDISKSHVSRVFTDVFGYDLAVDPTQYQGQAVEKSERNGVHDGRMVQCPIDKSAVKPGYTYQKYIDTSFSGEYNEDLRIATVFGTVAAVFHKHKAFDKRFSTSYLQTTVRLASEVFSEDELTLIHRFCDQMGLDFGAVDVLRDKHDGRIYIVDVNKTCMPVMSLPFDQQIHSHRMIGKVLGEALR